LNCHKQNPQLAAGTNYENPIVQRLIKQLKFENIKSASIPLARILEHCEPLKSYCAQPNTIIVPIPLGKKRLRQRGYNQSGLIAEQLQKNIGVRVEKNLLMRVKNTKPQTELAHGNARRENIKGCFEINKKTIVSKESNIVLLDDVATTGATLQEAADILKKNGYKKIIVTVIAKT
jgi:ComF family protein